MWFDIIFDNFYLIIGSGSIIWIILMIYYLSRPEMEVLYFSESDRRLMNVKIQKENPKSLEHKGSANMRFFKTTGSWSSTAFGGLKKVTSWLGKMGTAYTFKLEEGEPRKIGGLYEAVESVWGKETCDKLKQDQREQLQKSNIYVTVEIEKGITPKDFEPIVETDIINESKEKIIKGWAKGMAEGEKQPIINILMALMAGAGIGVILCLVVGWIKIT